MYTRLPGVELTDGPGMTIDRLRLCQGRPPGVPVQQLGLPNLGALGKEALFPGGILAQHLNGVLQLRQIPFGLRQRRRIPVQQSSALRQRLLGLAHFHTAHMKQLRQQRVPVLGKGDEPDPFHLDNCHLVSNHPS